jgi:hypothetical protein
MGIAVAAKEHDLEEQHARRPYPRTAAEPWQNEFADDGLDLKQEKSAEQAQQGELQKHGRDEATQANPPPSTLAMLFFLPPTQIAPTTAVRPFVKEAPTILA